MWFSPAKAIRELGVTRLSLGVENFDEHILEVNGRAHRSKRARSSAGVGGCRIPRASTRPADGCT